MPVTDLAREQSLLDAKMVANAARRPLGAIAGQASLNAELSGDWERDREAQRRTNCLHSALVVHKDASVTGREVLETAKLFYDWLYAA